MADLGSSYVWGPGASASSGSIVTKEDVLDLVINIDPYDTPGVTLLPKTTCSSTLHEWVTDTLDATATATNDPTATSSGLGAWPEGADFDERDVTTRTRVSNSTQIFRKDIKVTNTMRALNPFGVADEYSYQIMKAAKDVARNMEVALWRLAASAGSTGGVGMTGGRYWKSFEGLLTTNAAFARGTMLSNSASDSSLTSYPIRESDFNTMLQRIYTQGGNPDLVFVSPAVKRYISSWGVATAISAPGIGERELQATQNVGDRRLARRIDIYSSDFGDIQIVLNRWVPQSPQTGITANGATAMVGRMFVMERARNRIAFLRPVRHVPLPPGGDSTRGMVVGEATLEALAEKGSGLIKGVSPVAN